MPSKEGMGYISWDTGGHREARGWECAHTHLKHGEVGNRLWKEEERVPLT